ncbi:MAG: SpoIVB peptidase S55 domain-containing protein [Acidobacteriota bacterium]
MNKRISLLASLVFWAVGPAVFGQMPASAMSSSGTGSATRLMPVGEVKEGMRGIAKTVFRGSEAEEFNVEILGVVPGAIGPKQDLIIGRLSGGGADRTSVFAGMSGSPVYIDGRLVGAISYSFPFSKEPICGITPIQQMIEIFEKKPASASKAAEPRAVSFAEIASAKWQPEVPKAAYADSGLLSGFSQSSALMAVAGQAFRPIATPMTFNGFTQQALDAFAPQLLNAGLVPIAAVGGAAAITPMKPADSNTLVGGASVSMQLTRGDYSLAAAGTVTWRDGNKIYAFGHPFMSLGTSDLPMSESHVVTVVPNVNNSFKLAVPDSMVGSMTQDRATGVFGTLGVAPKMIPVRINLETSRGQKQTLNFEVARDDFLTPLLLNIAVYNSLISTERGLGDSMVQVNGEIKVKGQESIKVKRRFAGGQASQLAASSVAVPVNVLMKSRFDDLDISGLEVDLTSTDGSSIASLERMSVDRTQMRAGETAEVQVYARTNTGKTIVQRIPVKIPADTPAGPLTITVGDGAALQEKSAIQQFVPANLAELIRTINKVKFPDRLYLQTFRTTSGAIIGSNEMPNLPPSVLATLNNDRTAGGIKPAVQTIVGEIEIAPAEFIITGQQSLSIEIIK